MRIAPKTNKVEVMAAAFSSVRRLLAERGSMSQKNFVL